MSGASDGPTTHLVEIRPGVPRAPHPRTSSGSSTTAPSGEEGFWLRGGESAEVVLQALAPVRAIRLVVTSGPAGDIVTLRLGPDRERLVMRPLETRRVAFTPRVRPVGYYGSALYSLRFGSRFGGPIEADRRQLGSFVRIVLDE